ncbi:MAG: nucleotide exchange factor GrpE [Anaerolineae bacterium]
MSDKKKHEKVQPEEVSPQGGSPAEAVETPEGGTQPEVRVEAADLSAEIEQLRQKLSEAEARSAENLDGWQRALADFVNYKKRVERDNETLRLTMKGDIIKKFLPVLDDLERALQNRPTEGNAAAWAEGVELIVRKMQAILEAEGVKKIEAEGAPFDPNYHEAISHEPADGVESGHVIAVVQNGYVLGERVIRPALVRVAQ